MTKMGSVGDQWPEEVDELEPVNDSNDSAGKL